VDGPPLAWAPNVSRVHRYLEGRVRSRREPPGVGSRQASFFGSRRCRAESQASRGATPASPRGSCQRRGSRSARGCRRAPDARGTRPPLSRIQARRTRGSLARVHCRRLIARQAPEAADGSRSDLCAITLAQVNDSDREPIEHGRRAMRPESGASRQQVRQPAQGLQRRQEAHLPDGHLLHRCENDVPPHRDPEAVHLPGVEARQDLLEQRPRSAHPLPSLTACPPFPASGERVVINKNEAHVADDVPDAFIGTRVHSAQRRSSLVSSATSSSATTPAGSKTSTGCASRARKWPVLPLARAGRGRSGIAQAPRNRTPPRRRDRVASADRRALDARRPARARGRGLNERELQRLTGRTGAETTASSGVSRMRLPAT
jgi:hypothetical protein